MKITRIFTGSDGESHFTDIDIPLHDHGAIGMLSEMIEATGIVFRQTAADYDYKWHNAPSRRYMIILEGDVRFTVSDGEERKFFAGDVVLLEDTTGKGHYSQTISDKVRKSIFVMLDSLTNKRLLPQASADRTPVLNARISIDCRYLKGGVSHRFADHIERKNAVGAVMWIRAISCTPRKTKDHAITLLHNITSPQYSFFIVLNV